MKAQNQTQYWWQYLSWPDILERAQKCDIAILPLGAIEWHGPHLPTGHDSIQLTPMMERVAERTGAMLLPCPWYGAHPYHHYYVPGSIPLRNTTMLNLIKDVVYGASVAGYNKFIIFFGHGQAFVTNYAVQELGLEGYFVASVMFQNLTKDVQFDIMEGGFGHAEESETSIGLHLFPEFVDMSKAGKGTSTTLISDEYYQGVSEAASGKPCRFDEITKNFPEYRDKVIKTGIRGDATIATAEKGRKYVGVIVDRMVDFVNHIKETCPAGVKPLTMEPGE